MDRQLVYYTMYWETERELGLILGKGPLVGDEMLMHWALAQIIEGWINKNGSYCPLLWMADVP